jgi:predicted GNAT superfamily acetyltransferase
MDIRDATEADLPALLALNNAEAEAVNAWDAAGFAALMRRGVCRLMAGDPPAGFLLAFSHATPAQGPNHAWFLGREPRFLYVDRVVVAPAAQGRGLGRALYAALEAQARAAGIPALCCEVNLEPPNPGSLRFHERLGFVPAGQATDPRNGKVVRYLVKRLG